MNKYAELKKKHSEENNTLPLKAAFGDEQFEKMMKEWGLTTSKEDLMKIRSLGCGAFCLASDVYLFEEMRKRHDKEILELIKTDEGLKDAFMYEFANHECGYTYNPEEAVLALGITMRDVRNNIFIKPVFDKAWKEYLDRCE